MSPAEKIRLKALLIRLRMKGKKDEAIAEITEQLEALLKKFSIGE